MSRTPVVLVFACLLIVGLQAEPAENKQTLNQAGQPGANNPLALGQQSPLAKIGTSTLLATSVECRTDIQKYCVKKGAAIMPNFNVLQCINDLDDASNLIGKDCQNLIYKYKYNMTHDVFFDNAATRLCQADLKLLTECNSQISERGHGRLVSCLYDHLESITESACRGFISHIQVVVLTDWRLSEFFSEACQKDIVDLKCGRLDADNDTLPHDQGGVIACLSKTPAKLSPTCKKEISRLVDMQSNDYHLDRSLYYACRDDRERLCPTIVAGAGRVYRCLYDQKLNSMMSGACRKEVQRRQQMVVANALVDAPLTRACKNESIEHQCVAEVQGTDRQVSLVNLLLCLEDRIKKGQEIKEDCRREMLLHRRMLMSDYTLSPEIIAACNVQTIAGCSSIAAQNKSDNIAARGGRMIHCLLSAARLRKSLDKTCLTAINDLVRAVNPAGDIRADPLLETTCRPVIDALCSTVKPGDGNVILCLLENLKNTRMTEDCEDKLMDIAYFMQRDWRITPTLFASCRANLMKFCALPTAWSMSSNLSDTFVGKHLGCLYQNRLKLDGKCQVALKQLMFIRTQSIGLMPEIEDHCINDLSSCDNAELKGQEMRCLQEKYHELETECKDAVRNHTSITMTDPTLDFYLMKACESVIQEFCLKTEIGSENDLLRCLVKYRNHQKMDFRCRASIEHHQITSLKDKAFLSQQFQTKCKAEITQHCATKKDKASIVQCLADVILLDVLRKTKQINDECREELKFELLQRSENINLDPLLAKACESDIRKFCGSRIPGNAQVLDCLKKNENNISKVCYARLNKREKIDVAIPDNDYSLTTKCGTSIQRYCANYEKKDILVCLRRKVNEDRLPNDCRRVLYQRLMIFNSDARFNKALIENCQNDIDKHCHSQLDDADNVEDESENQQIGNKDDGIKDREMGGRIIGCLRSIYANTQVQLEQNCITEIVDVIQTSKLDIKLDVKLYQKCRGIVNANCPGVDKEDCLKVIYQRQQISDPECKLEVARIIREGRADINVDHALAFACQADLTKHCNDIPIGSSRQLQCLLKKKNSVSAPCAEQLSKRQELWRLVPDLENINDLAWHLVNSPNNSYFYTFIVLVLLIVFVIGCVCRPCVRYRRVRLYK